MREKCSRRAMLKAVGVMGAMAAPPLLAEGGKAEAKEKPETGSERGTRQEDLIEIALGDLVAEFDARNGILYAIRSKTDALGTNFLGNSDNTAGLEAQDTHWTGDLVSTVWALKGKEWIREEAATFPMPYYESGEWQKESTLDSWKSREVSREGNGFRVRYGWGPKTESGIRSFHLTMRYTLANDSSLHWDIEIENAGDRTLELGELALPLRANDDYGMPYATEHASIQRTPEKIPKIQMVLHEQKVFAHAFVAGHSSYVLLQRPKGDGPFLLLHCLDDTALECIYKTEAKGDSWIGTDLLALHSAATRDLRNWGWNPWVNGHSSLVLEPGEKKTYRMRFAFIRSYADIRDELYKAGNLGIRVLPSMVVQERTDARVELKSQSGLTGIEIHSDGVEVKEQKQAGGKTLLTCVFRGRGQKTLKLKYGDKRWTNLHFYCVEDAEELIKARARFMAERQFYTNPEDAYHRNHMFLPFDYRRGTRFDENDDVWEVGGTDDPGFGDPLFLAEKNVYLPSREEVEKLELYVDDCLFKYIQNPQTYEVRASLYWKKRTPSSQRGSWSEKRSEATWRNFNYCFVANIYHALYRTGRKYDVLRKRAATDYLRMSYRTALKWFEAGPYRHFGLITGSNAVNIVQDLEREGWKEEHRKLLGLMRDCNDEFLRDEYPYSSEMQIDETGQHQVYYFTRYFAGLGEAASRKKNLKVLRALKAMRGGDQPAWFWYGNDLFAHPDLRGQICCWHAEALNGMALLQGYEDTGDEEMLRKGYAGVMSLLHNVLPDGMGFGWFKLDPGVFACEPPKTFEGGPGLWGYLRAAKAYVVEDESFGRVGYGCEVEERGEELCIRPRDGVRKRVGVVCEALDVETGQGEIKELRFNRRTRELKMTVEDSTGLARTADVRIKGLAAGEYELKTKNSRLRVRADKELRFSIAAGEAERVELKRMQRKGATGKERATDGGDRQTP